MRLSAADVARITGGEVLKGDPARTAKGVSTDSRELQKGDGFVALEGERFDGHSFVPLAAEKGAAWALVAKKYDPAKAPGDCAVIAAGDTLKALGDIAAAHRKAHDVKVAAITGSVGKSTVKEMTALVLASKGKVLRNKGNFNNRVGLPLTLFRLDRSHRYLVTEMGCNMPGEIAELARIAGPDAGAITRVAPAHLEGLGSIGGVAKAKAELISGLAPGGTFALNLDDPMVVKQAKIFKGNVVAWSADPAATFDGELVRLESVEKDVQGGRPRVVFTVRLLRNNKKRGKAVTLHVWSLSRHNAVNALAAMAIGRAFGVGIEEAAERIKGFKGMSGRGEVARSKKGVLVVDDTYNASPSSVETALDTVAWWKGPMRGIAVLGDMLELGDHAEKYHREAGRKVAESGMSMLIARGDNAEAMVEAALEAGLPEGAAVVARDNKEAARILGKNLRRGDWVLVKGSRAMGMEAVAREIAR